MTAVRLPQIGVDHEFVPLDGGLDLVTPALTRKPGSLIDCVNFVPGLGGGCTRVGGYERFDGRPSPSAAKYWLLGVLGIGGVSVGASISGLTSGATAVVSSVVSEDVISITKVVGSFVVGETISIGGVVTEFYERGASSMYQDAELINAAASIYRSDIGGLPGTGPVRGVHMYGGVVYAWRDNNPPPVINEADAAWSASLITGTWTYTDTSHTAELSVSGGSINNIQCALSQSSGKRYLEFVWVSSDTYHDGVRHDVGITVTSPPVSGDAGSSSGIGYRKTGRVVTSAGLGASIPALSNGDVVGLAVDLATGKVWLSRNGVWVSGDPATDTSPSATLPAGTYFPFAAVESGAALKVTVRTKQSLFSHAIPSGFTSWGFVSETPGGVADAMHMYKSSSSGWQQVALGHELPFGSGTGTAVAVGDTISNLAGTATGTVSAVVLESGSSWSGGSGRLILSAVTGTWAASDQIRVSGSQRATATAGASAITLLPGGKVRCFDFNFLGSATGKKMYGADGKNRCFEFDGTTYIPIRTTAPVDAPVAVVAHRNRLIAGVLGSLFVSGPGSPVTGWNSITSTPAEIGVSDLITDLLVMQGSGDSEALAVFCRNRVSILYGKSPSDFVLVPAIPDCGAEQMTAQSIGASLYLDGDSLRDIASSDTYGNFASSAVSELVQPMLTRKAGLVTCSSLVRSLNQYRLWFSDGYGLAFKVTRRGVEAAGPIKYEHPVMSCFSGDDEDGREVFFFGSDNGFVYQSEVGTSFDGEDIMAWIRSSFVHAKSPSAKKSWKRVRVDADVSAIAEIEVSYDHNYADTNIGRAVDKFMTVVGGGVIWDSTIVWDSFIWDAPYLSPPVFKLDGSSQNISILIRSQSKLSAPFTIQSMLIANVKRRLVRGGI